MEKEVLIKYVEENKTIRDICELVGKSQTTVKYWLKKYDLKTNHKSFGEQGKKDYGGSRFCNRCQTEKSIEDFYSRRGKKGSSPYCKPCTNEQVIERQRKLKQIAIDYKGGCCERCGYDKYNGALEFHHTNPTEKDFNISKLKQTNFTEKVKKELDKCILVCANCHREIHGGL